MQCSLVFKEVTFGRRCGDQGRALCIICSMEDKGPERKDRINIRKNLGFFLSSSRAKLKQGEVNRWDRVVVESIQISYGLKWGSSAVKEWRQVLAIFLTWTAAELGVLVSEESCTGGLSSVGYFEVVGETSWYLKFLITPHFPCLPSAVDLVVNKLPKTFSQKHISELMQENIGW